ncbi:tyrosine-type recombinase/integrase [Subtercola endophyticus]|uniref:tyrosine-type recombinase/integrase n=1 Tax=Subtercola endophyticus TaxID=2895559 RepID=UPI001E49BE6E|nr:tyrosine-type recombinase/integrase [Subtercola endophyticus]UFS57649.1 site-specific integrase [Subtercola endophyticus]
MTTSWNGWNGRLEPALDFDSGINPRTTSFCYGEFRIAAVPTFQRSNWSHMGSVNRYATAHGPRYRVRFRKPDHSHGEKRGFRTKKEADLYLADVELRKSRGTYVDPMRGRITVSDWIWTWFDARTDMRATTRTRVDGIIRNHIVLQLGETPIGSLTRLRLQQWAMSLPGSPASVRKCVNVLSSALQLAVDDEILPSNPAVKLNLPRVAKSRKRYLTHEQVENLAREVGRRAGGDALGYDVLVYVLAYCGLRWGELSGLRIQDLDLERKRLHVNQTVVADKGYQRFEAPKNYEVRQISIPNFLVEPLRRQIAGRGKESPVFFGKYTRTWLRNHAFRKSWLDDAAIAIGETGLTPHELRHTAASLAISAGANVKAVQKMLGHASAAITLDTYADLFDTDLDAVGVALDHAAMKSSVGKVWANTEKRPDEVC